MINKYSISNFKIHKLGYIFNLNGLIILTGTNNSGKSSLTQSLRLLSKINRNSFSYTKLPFEQVPELGDFRRTLNKDVSRRESIKYKLSLKIEDLKFCNVELEFDSIYNYKLNFNDMTDAAILKRIDIYFKNSKDLVKNYEFVMNMDISNPITYDLNEIILNDVKEKRILLQKGILVKGIYPNFIPQTIEEGFKELLVINSHLGNINESSIKYVPALRNNGNTADILDNFKDSTIFDGKTKLIDAFYIWTNKILNSEFRLKIEDNRRKIIALENNIEFDLLQIGFGNSQILPILITILTAKKGDLVIIENPEVHLHPKWKTNLVELFYYAVKFGVNILIETQSLEIVNRVRLFVKNDNTLKDKTSLYFFENHGLKSSIQKIEIEDTGNLDLWPDDFVDKVTIEDNFGLL
ncbi:DUF3696 domain-containing protein [Clostridium sp. P21]|uniref:DUF3696 domain-containing protein n=1 Tax=Clostridium muellerianum TaxID=2716538 RepID=A0A7Y0EG72_9CLOT|nr:DUF3696 domain-containing protein [Clostridium muellerianum]NMM62828.1 DUF3696 domain-containing protein [Clostridium muellerianum]